MLKRRGFTLIELMVVISIITILLGILLPVMNRVRQSGTQTVCLGNMRQITFACISYARENEDQLPFCNWGDPNNTGVYGHGWMFSSSQFRTGYPATSDLNGSWGSPHMPLDGVTTGVLWPYIHNLTVYHCPEAQQEFFSGTEWMSSYLCNGAQCGYGAVTNLPGYHLGRFNTQGVYFWEAQEQLYENQKPYGCHLE